MKRLINKTIFPGLLFLLGVYCHSCLAEFQRNYRLPPTGTDLVGENLIVATREEDTLIDVASRKRLGYNLLRSANPTVDAWLPGEGTEVLLPLQTILPKEARSGIVINTPEMRLYFYKTDKKNGPVVSIYSISVGRGEWATPITHTRITGRVKNPSWYPPESIRAEHAARGDLLPRQVKPGPDNPLGEHLLMLDIPSYFIHGTNRRFGIGMQVTHGCIRMYPEDIATLFGEVSNNVPVLIINQPFKYGWSNQGLYLEVHPPLESAGQFPEIKRGEVIDALHAELKKRPETLINWQQVDKTLSEMKGLPEKVGFIPNSLEDFDG